MGGTARMKPQTLRTFIEVHTWVGLIAGFALFIAFYCGAITVFSHELLEWEDIEEHQRPHDSIADADALIAAALQQHPRARENFNLQLPGEHGPRMVMYWYERLPGGTFAAHEFRWSSAGLEESTDQSRLGEFIDRLHYTMGLPDRWGVYTLGFVCILYGVALVTGIIMYAPGFLRDLFALRIGKNLKRFWQDAHNVIGVLSLPFHVIFAWSGAVLCIGTLLLAPFQFLVFDGKLLPLIEPDLDVVSAAPATNAAAPMLPAEQLLERARQALPDLDPESLSFTQAGDANAQVTIHGHTAARTLTQLAGVALDANTGELLRVVEPETFSAGTTFLRGLTSLHFGEFGHLTVKWLYFILGMAGAFLFYSGNLLWIETRRNRRGPSQTRSSKVMAQLTLGVSLGCIAGVSAAFVANRVLSAGHVEMTYFVLFFGALAWALLRPPIRAAYELLWICVVVTAAIPVANAAATGMTPWHSVSRGEWVMVSVDAVACAFAWMFWRMARAVRRRGMGGDPNSVWALPTTRAVTAQPQTQGQQQ